MWYATLALLRCVASSPAAAVKALTTRLEGTQSEEDLLTDERLHDGAADDLSASDLEPPAQTQVASRLQDLIATAQRLSGQSGDPKLFDATLALRREPLSRQGLMAALALVSSAGVKPRMEVLAGLA